MSFRYAVPPHAVLQLGEEYQGVQFTFVQVSVNTQESLSLPVTDGLAHYESFCEMVSQLLQVEAPWVETSPRGNDTFMMTYDLGSAGISANSEASMIDLNRDPSFDSVTIANTLKLSSQIAPDTVYESSLGPRPSSLREDVKVNALDFTRSVMLLPPSSTLRIMSDVSSGGSSALTITSGESTTTTTASEYYGGGGSGGGTGVFSPTATEVRREEAIMDALEVLSFSDESTALSLVTSPKQHQSLTASEGFSCQVADRNMEDFLSGSLMIGDSDFCPLPSHHQVACRARSRLSTVSSTASSAASTVDSVVSSSSNAKPVRRHQRITHKLSRVVDRVSDHLSSSRSRRSHSSYRSSTSSATGSKRYSELFRESLASKRDSVLDQYAEL